MDGYLAKPIDPMLLLAAVEQADARDVTATPVSGAARLTFDVDALRRRMLGDEGLMSEVMQVFLTDLPGRLSAIDSALTDQNAQALCAAAATLKGAASSVSADRLFDAAHQLEDLGGGLAPGDGTCRLATIV